MQRKWSDTIFSAALEDPGLVCKNPGEVSGIQYWSPAESNPEAGVGGISVSSGLAMDPHLFGVRLEATSRLEAIAIRVSSAAVFSRGFPLLRSVMKTGHCGCQQGEGLLSQ